VANLIIFVPKNGEKNPLNHKKFLHFLKKIAQFAKIRHQKKIKIRW
jgi:hypothetical protein